MLPITPNYVMFCAVQNAQCNIKELSSNTAPISLGVTLPSPDGASPPFHRGGGRVRLHVGYLPICFPMQFVNLSLHFSSTHLYS